MLYAPSGADVKKNFFGQINWRPYWSLRASKEAAFIWVGVVSPPLAAKKKILNRRSEAAVRDVWALARRVTWGRNSFDARLDVIATERDKQIGLSLFICNRTVVQFAACRAKSSRKNQSGEIVDYKSEETHKITSNVFSGS